MYTNFFFQLTEFFDSISLHSSDHVYKIAEAWSIAQEVRNLNWLAHLSYVYFIILPVCIQNFERLDLSYIQDDTCTYM